MESFNVILDTLDKLCLVLTDSTSDVRTNKQGIETGKDSEHFIGIFGCSKLISEPGCDSCLNTVNTFIISKKKKLQF